MKLPVAYFSQFDPSVPVLEQNRVCSLACIKMVVDFLRETSVGINELIAERDFLASRVPSYGVSHAGAIIMLRNRGVAAYSQEFRSHAVDAEKGVTKASGYEQSLIDYGIKKMAREVDSGTPVIVSVTHQDLGTPHQVLVCGTERGERGELEGLYIHDPYKRNDELVTGTDFADRFRNMAIFCSCF